MAEFDDLNASDDTEYAAPKPKSRMGFLLGLLALLGLSGGGFVAYTMFVPADDFAYAPPPPVAAQAPAPEAAPVVADAPLLTEAIPAPAAAELSPAATVITDAETPAPAAEAVIPQTDPVAAVTAGSEAPVAAEPAAAMPEAVPAPVATIDAVNDALAETEAVPAAPPQQQLQPIEPVTKEEKTAEAVKEILGADAPMKPSEQDAQLNNIAKQVEVTPRAKQVIIVKKAYSAQSAEAMNAAGDRVLKAGGYADAVKIYDSRLQNNPSDPIALAGKAQALQQEGQDDAAMAVWQRLLELNPRDVEALTNYLGLLQKQQPDEALEKLKELSAQYPENAGVAAQIAMASATLTDTPTALKNFRKAIALDPTEPTYPFNMAVLYDRLGTTDKAREGYTRALNVVRDFPEKASRVPVEIIRARLRALSL
jgi:tetratricopeptide (TPR) repeat protein